MLYRIILILIFCLSVTSGFAQSNYFTITETKPFKDTKRNTTLENVFTLLNGQVVAVRSAKKELMVTQFDTNYAIIFDLEIELDRREEYIGALSSNNEVTVFTLKKIDKRIKQINAHVYTAGTQTLKSSVLYTATKDEKKVSKFSSILPRKHIENFRVSPNGEYIAFAIENIDARTNAFSIRIFDKNLSKVYETRYYDNLEKYFVFDDFVVTNSAEVISAGKLYKKGKRDKKGGKANYQYVLHRVKENSSVSETIDLGDNFVQELRFTQTYNDSLRLLGFYSEKKSSSMKGAISFTLSGTDITGIKSYESPFPESVYSDIYREKKAERLKGEEKEVRSYYLDYALIDENGDSYLLAEQFYVTQSSTMGANGAMMTTWQQHYDNILAIKFDHDGKMVWGRSILKADSRPSYNTATVNGKLHVFLNAGKNVKEKADGRKRMRRGFFTSTALYDIVFNPENGDLTREQIQENSKNTSYRPYLGTFTDTGFIMGNISKGKKQFMILSKK